ncbi:hypothetical protein ACFWTE_14550 [Nocardiopsis sp. NPDC058631]|uniref:hypothetical protein n=1 Tax=Nocardiopsis sp. NPDC058631 TaxID=3346566 RepID=UPI00365E2BBF
MTELACGRYYDDEQLTALVAQIALINAFNRMGVPFRQAGGGYVPGQHGQVAGVA